MKPGQHCKFPQYQSASGSGHPVTPHTHLVYLYIDDGSDRLGGRLHQFGRRPSTAADVPFAFGPRRRPLAGRLLLGLPGGTTAAGRPAAGLGGRLLLRGHTGAVRSRDRALI